MKNVMLIILMPLLLSCLISCDSFPTKIAAKKIEVDMPGFLTGSTRFRLTEVQYLKDGIFALLDNDSEWFMETELPAMIQVLAGKYGLAVRKEERTLFAKNPDNEHELTIWIHEMKKAHSFPRRNTISIILTIKKKSEKKHGKIMFIDETGYSVLNSSYAHHVFESIIKCLSEQLTSGEAITSKSE
jgi:hypothetical protein